MFLRQLSGLAQGDYRMDDEDVQGSHPFGYCRDLDCWCHTDVDYHASVTSMSEASADEIALANTFFEVAA